jgi:long-chain acyl-CoA synthetase
MLLAALAVWARGAAVLPLDARAAESWRLETAARGRVSYWVARAGVGELELVAASEKPSVPETVGLVLFTSGSSGPPKGVLLSAAGILANLDGILDYLPIVDHPRTALVLPLWYCYALVGQALTTLRAGGTLILLGDLPFPPLQLEAMVRLGATGLSAVPLSLRLIAESVLENGGAARPRLGYLASAGAPLDEPTLKAVRSAFPEARLFNQYGLTEASPRVTAVSDREPAFALGSVGRPLRGLDVFAASPEGGRLPAGEEGELCVRGPSVMVGYLDHPQATARVLSAEGILRTGDHGWVDAQGYVYVGGRADGVVKCAGERVRVALVAEALRRAGGVEVSVVAGPVDGLGTRLVAFIEGSAAQVQAAKRAARELPPAKRPGRISSLSPLPRTPNGKTDLGALRLLAEEA